MPTRPTQAALQKHPGAVVMLAAEATNPDVWGLMDFEWFDTDEQRTAYFDEVVQFFESDFVTNGGDLFSVIVDMNDTSTYAVTRIAANGPDDWKQRWLDKIAADPTTVVAQSTVRQVKPKTTKTGKTVVKGRKPSAAAAAVGSAPTAVAPTPKASKAAKNAAKNAAKKADPPKAADTPAQADGTNKRQAALKARIAAKQQQKATPDPVDPGDAAEAADSAVDVMQPSMGFSVRAAALRARKSHDCMDNAVPYTSDGPLGHGWECGKCGKFLQAG